VWTPPVLRTVANDGRGIPELAATLERHLAWLQRSRQGTARARYLAQRRILREAAAQALRAAERLARKTSRFEPLVEAVATYRLSPSVAAGQLLGLDTGDAQCWGAPPGRCKVKECPDGA
jgi:LAO/AO transport system kinase